MQDRRFKPSEYKSALLQLAIAPHHIRMLQAHYHAPGRKMSATQMAKSLGYPRHVVANLHYGKLGRAVGQQLGWSPLPRQPVFVLVNFEKRGREWQWILRPAVAKALEQLGWINGDSATIPEEVIANTALFEGAVRRVFVNAYERNNAAREQCILHHGCRCTVCGLILAEKYGNTAQGLIHVHHLKPLAEINSRYEVNPVADLRPVCPTCHAVIHSRTPAFTIEEVKAMIEGQKGGSGS